MRGTFPTTTDDDDCDDDDCYYRYTDNIDRPFPKPAARVRAQMEHICALLTGVAMCLNYKRGQALVEDRDFAQYKDT